MKVTSFILWITILTTLLFPIKSQQLDVDYEDEKSQHGTRKEFSGAGYCSSLAGCKTKPTLKCESIYTCPNCFNLEKKAERNVMRSDFYNFDLEFLKTTCNRANADLRCPRMYAFPEIPKYMLLQGDGVAVSFQGAPYKDLNIPKLKYLYNYYDKTFCDSTCVDVLTEACLRPPVLRGVRNWCLTILNWIKDKIPKLVGPPSYVLFLAARLTTKGWMVKPPFNIVCEKSEPLCEWPRLMLYTTATAEVQAALVAAAAASVFLAPDWFKDNINDWKFKENHEFGFAVQHSLWLASFAGRLRITLQPNYHFETSPIPASGQRPLCNIKCLQQAQNYEGSSGNVYASLAALFVDEDDDAVFNGKDMDKDERDYKIRFKKRFLKFRPEIHEPNDLGCVEKVSGMVFIRPGDWVNSHAKYSVIGSKKYPLGMTSYDNNQLTTFELTNSKLTLYPPSIRVSLLDQKDTRCTSANGNGPNSDGMLGGFGIKHFGGMCNWVPTW